MARVNELNQPIGPALPGWTPPPMPAAPVLHGRYCRLERLDPYRHIDELFDADRHDTTGASWTYLPYGPFPDLASYREWMDETALADDPFFYTVVDTDPTSSATTANRAVGVLSLMHIQTGMGSVEVGHVHYSPLLQRRRAGTDAEYVLMKHVFDDLGYRRYEWKTDALNAASRGAAERLGFRHEGVFRQAMVIKGRSRDTAWYSIIDGEWPAVRDGFEAWLDPRNFDETGRQRTPLDLRSS